MPGPLPENNTPCLFLDYTAGTIEHTMLLRIPPPAVADVGDYASAYATIFAQRMHPVDSFFRARFRDEGADFSLPIPFTAVPGALPGDTASWEQDPESVQYSLVMRGTTTGRRSRVEFFSPVKVPPWPADNRYNPGDAAVIDTFRVNFTNAAEGSGTSPLVSIGGDLVTVYGYVNIRSNAYWQTKQRLQTNFDPYGILLPQDTVGVVLIAYEGMDVGVSRGDDGNSTNGPDWNDVRDYLAHIEYLSHCRVQLLIKTEANFSNRRGFRVELWLDGLPVVLASCGIGRGYAAGARTMAGAAYQACLRGEETLELSKTAALIARDARRRQRSKRG